jgi:hypothetical protein
MPSIFADKCKNIIKNYDSKMLVADFLFAFDLIANGAWGDKYYEIFTSWGLSGNSINTIVSILEIVRVFMLVAQRRNQE